MSAGGANGGLDRWHLFPETQLHPFDSKFTVKVLVIVNSSPWGGSLGVTALRLVRAMLQPAMLQPAMLVPDGADALRIAAVYFREEGVYHALPGRVTDSGTPALRDAWLALATQHGLPLLLCSSAAQRRLEDCPSGGFREAGLAEVLDVMRSCDRVVSF